jgi:hypothetical protein
MCMNRQGDKQVDALSASHCSCGVRACLTRKKQLHVIQRLWEEINHTLSGALQGKDEEMERNELRSGGNVGLGRRHHSCCGKLAIGANKSPRDKPRVHMLVRHLGNEPGLCEIWNDKGQTNDCCVSRTGVGRFFGDRSHTAHWAADLR